MTPDLFEEGARRVQQHAALEAGQTNTESGGRNASEGRIATPGEVDVTHGRMSASVLTASRPSTSSVWTLRPASCAASSAPTAQARRR